MTVGPEQDKPPILRRIQRRRGGQTLLPRLSIFAFQHRGKAVHPNPYLLVACNAPNPLSQEKFSSLPPLLLKNFWIRPHCRRIMDART